jgi:hypothetical protein
VSAYRTKPSSATSIDMAHAPATFPANSSRSVSGVCSSASSVLRSRSPAKLSAATPPATMSGTIRKSGAHMYPAT